MSTLRFSAVVGQQPAKLALLLAASQPRLGGVLLRGDKGSAKTTLARGLAALLPGDAPFVELPLGATEERLIGSLDLAELLTNGRPRFHPGLLAAAHGGVLYVDEINLLADHLVDALLDVAVSGVNRVEREGLSHTHEARFVLVGSMNPEEGELRPQLLDRFGLAVDVVASDDVAERVTAVRRQLDAEAEVEVPGTDPTAAGSGPTPGGPAAIERLVGADGLGFAAADAQLRARITEALAAVIEVDDDLIETASRLAVAVGVEGLRADLMLCRAAAAHAALDERSVAGPDDLRAVAELVLGHRRRRRPFDEPGIAPEELDQAWADATEPPLAGEDQSGSTTDDDRHDDPSEARQAVLPTAPPPRSGATRASNGGGGAKAPSGPRGRYLRDEPFDPARGDIDARATAAALAPRRAVDAEASVTAADLRGAQRETPRGSLVVFVVDASASMGVEHRMAGTKAAIIGLLGDAYRRRGRVALVTFRGETAEVVLRPTASVEVARARLAELATGGTTPLAAGLDAARDIVAGSTGDRALDCHVIVLTDGRATAGPGDPVTASHEAAARLARTAAQVVIVDTESGPTRLGLARALADSIGAACFRLDELGRGLEGAVRAELALS